MRAAFLVAVVTRLVVVAGDHQALAWLLDLPSPRSARLRGCNEVAGRWVATHRLRHIACARCIRRAKRSAGGLRGRAAGLGARRVADEGLRPPARPRAEAGTEVAV